MSAPGAVSIARCDDYLDTSVDPALEALLRPLGGMSAFVRPGDRVFLKVNLLMKAEPGRAVTTHPALVRAVAEAAWAAGAADVMIGDSPGGRTSAGAARAIFEASGMAAVAEETGARLVLLDDDVVRRRVPEGFLYTSFNLGRAALEADVLINMPKLKTHGFMMMTGAVKNLFGCIPGLEKAQFHLKVPDRADFGDMLVDLFLACRPALSVLDAVDAMEGDGPSGGPVRHVGVLIASADAVALDVVASSVAGFEPLEVYTNAAAHRRGLGPADADEVTVHGTAWRDVAPGAFARPARDLARRLPRGLAQRVRPLVTSRPRLGAPEACTGCRTCERDCPVGAITCAGGRPAFDDERCIRCYCCQELCPAQAIDLATPWLARLLAPRDRA